MIAAFCGGGVERGDLLESWGLAELARASRRAENEAGLERLAARLRRMGEQ